MSEMVIRFNSKSVADAEICIKKGNDFVFKKLSFKKLLEILNAQLRDECKAEKIKLLDRQIIALGSNYVVINQPGHKKIVTLRYDDFSNSYKINFPNSIYIIKFSNNKVNDIYAYSYVEYLGLETKLYEYPMPNELSGQKICIGSAKREIVADNYIEALERIIATSYTHRHFSGIKGFSDSRKWFEYLSKNDFPYKLMRNLNKKLEDIVIWLRLLKVILKSMSKLKS